MTRTRLASIVTLVFVTGGSGSALAASVPAPAVPNAPAETAPRGPILQGTITDQRGRPVSGALVSATGEQTRVSVTDGAGRFAIAGLPAGPYLLRVHQKGYVPARAVLVQTQAGVTTVPAIRLTEVGAPRLLAAGAGPAGTVENAAPDASELAWRLRHARRGALDDVAVAVVPAARDDAAPDRALDLPLSGQFNLLTSASFDRPQDLFLDRLAPNGLAYLTLVSPAPGGEWRMRGTLTQGDLSAWMGAGSYTRDASAEHAYEAGASFSRQRYDGGNVAALEAVGEGGRAAGSLYAIDHWRLGRARVSYGGRYDRYDYLQDRGLLSAHASVVLDAGRGLRLTGALSNIRRAPGAQEFAVPEDVGLGFSPARTFSPLSAQGVFRPERVRHLEAGVEQDLGETLAVTASVFAQRVDDQMIALFGVDRAGSALTRLGHYFVGAAGDYRASGLRVGVRRALGEHVSGSVDYSMARASWTALGADRGAAITLSEAAFRAARERVGDLRATVNAELPSTATRILVVYRLVQANPVDDAGLPLGASRFDVQVHQTLPFLRFTNAQWAALVALQNQVRDAFDQSVYDELLAVQAPRRLMGGLTVRF